MLENGLVVGAMAFVLVEVIKQSVQKWTNTVNKYGYIYPSLSVHVSSQKVKRNGSCRDHKYYRCSGCCY